MLTVYENMPLIRLLRSEPEYSCFQSMAVSDFFDVRYELSLMNLNNYVYEIRGQMYDDLYEGDSLND